MPKKYFTQDQVHDMVYKVGTRTPYKPEFSRITLSINQLEVLLNTAVETVQNEQQEAVAVVGYIIDEDGRRRWEAELFDSAYELPDGTKLYTSPPKQAIPEGWKLVPTNLPYDANETRKIIADYFQKSGMGQCILFDDLWRDIINAAPTNTGE